MAKYNVYQGQFVCHVCKAEVKSLRSYPSEQLLTWMCANKHISEVNLNPRKKKDEREERE